MDYLSKNKKLKLVTTLGENGVIYKDFLNMIKQEAIKAKVVDKIAAGDTFLGYFIASIYKFDDINKALKIASQAAALAVERNGAADSIPTLNEVLAKLNY